MIKFCHKITIISKCQFFVDSLRNLLPWQRSWVSKYDHKIEISWVCLKIWRWNFFKFCIRPLILVSYLRIKLKKILSKTFSKKHFFTNLPLTFLPYDRIFLISLEKLFGHIRVNMQKIKEIYRAEAKLCSS